MDNFNNAHVIYNQETKVPLVDFQLSIIQSLCFPDPMGDEDEDELEEIGGAVGQEDVLPAPKHDPMS